MTEFLDEPLFFLGRPDPEVLDVALLRLGSGKVALLFSREATARRHLSALPAGTAVLSVNDLRAKEELFRAALARGAAELWLDAEVGHGPLVRYPLERALNYVLSFKRQSACL